MILIFCYKKIFIKWFWHATRLVRSGRQFVFKILYYIIRLIIYQIIRFIWLVFCIKSVWQVNLIKMVIYKFRTQRPMKNPIKHLRWSFLQKYLRYIILDNWLRSKYASGISKVALRKCASKGKHLRKNEKQILYCKNRSSQIEKLFWNVPEKSCS